MLLPKKIQSIIGDKPYSIDNIGKSDSQVICFEDMVLKIENQHEESNNEFAMLNWLYNKIPVPKILCYEQMNHVNYMLMSRVEGQMLCSMEFLEQPQKLIKAIANGLKKLWSVDITDCPYNNCIDNKLRLAENRINNDLCGMEDVEPDTYGERGFKTPYDLFHWLKENKPAENLILTHGDFCLPNIFCKSDRVTGFIDLGRSGIADKYQDIALCYRSLKHNFDGTYGGSTVIGFNPDMLFDELEIEPDWELINYYILLDELF